MIIDEKNIMEAAYRGYRADWLEDEGNYAQYAANVDRPKSFDDFVKSNYTDKEKVKEYLYFFWDLMHPEDPDTDKAKVKADRLYSEYLICRNCEK